VTTSRALRWQ